MPLNKATYWIRNQASWISILLCYMPFYFHFLYLFIYFLFGFIILWQLQIWVVIGNSSKSIGKLSILFSLFWTNWDGMKQDWLTHKHRLKMATIY